MKPQRSERLAQFIDEAQRVFRARMEPGTPAAATVERAFATLAGSSGVRCATGGQRLPVCRLLAPAVAHAKGAAADLAALADAFVALEPEVHWRRRPSDDPVFAEGHASAWIVGPGAEAIEQRDDVRLGVSLMAPGIVYPDHRHPPEEVYVALSPGAWRQNDGPWREPGTGGTVYNPADIVHAMRAAPSAPLFAVWCLSDAPRP